MAFKRLKGDQGLLYVPDVASVAKKHRCPDCYFCQWCSDERCRRCRQGPTKRQPAGRCRRPRPHAPTTRR